MKNNKGTPHDEEAEKILFMEMCEICLWGNATDLSLLTSLSYDDIQKLQGSEARDTFITSSLPACSESETPNRARESDRGLGSNMSLH